MTSGRSGAADGAQLERAVEEIERVLLPEGFTVGRRIRVPDPETGEVIAELDIVIKGPLGSSGVEWLIECRDRPSEGPAPVSWIEQLATRRARLNFDRVFAVSTTGFSGPAEKLAKQLGVRLRTVRTIEDMAHDFNVVSFTVHDHRFEPTDLVRVRGQVGRLRETGALPAFRRLGQKEFVTLPDFVVDILRERHDLPQADSVETIDFDYHRPCQMRTPSGRVLTIQGFRVRGELYSSIIEAQALTAMMYADDQQVIGKQGQFEWQTKGRTVKATITITPKGIKVDIPDDQLPPGTTPRFLSVEVIPRPEKRKPEPTPG